MLKSPDANYFTCPMIVTAFLFARILQYYHTDVLKIIYLGKVRKIIHFRREVEKRNEVEKLQLISCYPTYGFIDSQY